MAAGEGGKAGGRLYLVGAGLARGHLTADGLAALRASDAVFCEEYTSTFDGFGNLASEFRAKTLKREAVEDGKDIIEAAKGGAAALLVVGDPMSATTHVSLAMQARAYGVDVVYVPGVTVMSAVPNLLGLSSYKFGRATTVQFPSGGYFPMSQYETVEENRARGLHTLVLVDILGEERRYMTVSEALALLLEMEARLKHGVLSEATEAAAVVDAFGPKQTACFGTFAQLMAREFPPGLCTIVIPGELHFVEREALERYKA